MVVPTADDASSSSTAACDSIAETTPVADAIEIVIADAGTTDAAAAVAGAWSEHLRLTHIRADAATGAIGAITRGAEAARGELLVIVDDRTRLLRGWLRPLVRTLRDTPDAGVVGGMLLTADGAVEEAGGVLFADGSITGFGQGSPDPRAPVLGYVRDVPYVSAGLLATRRGLLRRLGGVDHRFGERYADIDYCLRVQAAGLRVVYQPQSVAVGPTPPGVDASNDGRRRFTRRWTAALAALPQRPELFDAATWDRLARSA